MLIAYARTSTTDQSAGLDAQLAALSTCGSEKTFSEQTSAASSKPRPQLEAAIEYAREGDTLIVTKLDRLARSVADLLSIIERLDKKNVSLRILDLGGSAVDTRGPTGKLILNIFASIGQFEREIMLERQLHGIAAAKALGRYKGRTPTARNKAPEVTKLHASGEAPSAIAKALKISRASVFRILKDTRKAA